MFIKPSVPHGHLELALRLFEPDFIEVSATYRFRAFCIAGL
jgi:hypothetical protein